MDYSRLATCYAALEDTPSTLEKADILADLFREAGPDELEVLAVLVMGRAFPDWNDLDLGIGNKLMVKAISRATGFTEREVENAWRDEGDLGDVAATFVQSKKQRTLAQKTLTVQSVQDVLEDIATTEGTNSQDRKLGRITELIGFASPDEARYIVRTILGSMRVGVGEGTVRDGIINAFFADLIEPKEFTKRLEDEGLAVAITEDVREDATSYGLFDDFEAANNVTYIDTDDLTLTDLWRIDGFDLVVLDDPRPLKTRLERLVQHGYDVTTDFGRVAQIAATEGPDGLKELDIELFRPVKVMLAQKAESLRDGMNDVSGDGIAIEYKYDGMRIQVHKDGDDVRVFTRRLEDVTEQFPDIVTAVREHVTLERGILEGEAVAYNPDNDALVPFQQLSKRIKRKYDINEMVAEIPVTLYLFDIIQEGDRTLVEEPLRTRWAALKESVVESEREIELSDHIETRDLDEAESFYQAALQAGHEGVMLKNLDARYKPGSRVGYMMKVKPVMETLDLVIVEADWGEGRRSNWMGSYLLACRDPKTGDFQTVGKMATGFTDEQLQEMTDRLDEYILREEGRQILLEPRVVVEVAYEELQKSPTYESGYALRFPRLVQVREDKGPEDADTLDKVERLYAQQ